MGNKKIIWTVILSALAVVYVLLRFWHLTDSCLWFDELFGVHAATLEWREMLWFVAQDLIHPPLFYVLLKCWISVGGETLFWLRCFPVLFSILALFAFYQFCKQLKLSYPAIAIAFAFFACKRRVNKIRAGSSDVFADDVSGDALDVAFHALSASRKKHPAADDLQYSARLHALFRLVCRRVGNHRHTDFAENKDQADFDNVRDLSAEFRAVDFCRFPRFANKFRSVAKHRLDTKTESLCHHSIHFRSRRAVLFSIEQYRKCFKLFNLSFRF